MLTISEIADCRVDLLTFTKTVFKHRYNAEFIENWHHKTICKYLEKVFIGDIKRLIINLPPRYSKTELAVINFIAWSIGIFSDCEFIHASYSKRLATGNTAKVKAIVESDIYKSIFKNVSLSDDSKAKDEWKTTDGGIVYAAGSGGSITGYGAGKMREKFGGAIIIDDPHKALESYSEIRRQNVIDWFTSTMESRTNSPHTPIIIIMQRLHEMDLTGFLLSGGNGETWSNLVIPVLDSEEKPLWEFKHTLDKLETIRESMPYVFSSQYMQSPSPLGGGIFKDVWWQYYKIAPEIEYKIITADTAQKTKNHNDYSVFQCWGFYQNKIYLLDQIRGKWEAPDLKIQFKAFWHKHLGTGVQTVGRLRSAYIEDKVSGTGLIQDLKRNDNIPVVAVQRNIDKVTRAMDMSPYIASGYVYLPENAEWLLDYLSEFSKFTPDMTHSHDDQIDPTLDAIAILLGSHNKESGTW